jgi:glycosyltransferase involved in cell wall biosynthesis
MKIGLVSFNYVEYCIRLAVALARKCDVLLCVPREIDEPHAALLEGSSVKVEWFDKPRLRNIPAQVKTLWHITRCLREYNPDVLHLQQGYLWFNLFMPLMKSYPLVLTVHDPQAHVGDVNVDHYFQWLTNTIFRCADEIIVHAEQNLQVLIEALNIPRERIHVIPHIALGDATAAPDIPEEDGMILFFGRIWEYKGLEYLIRAEPLITARRPDALIVIAGRGEDFEHYRRMMIHPDRFVVENRYISESEVAQFFRRASVIVLPYIEASQSGVIPVAYTYGKPVVATTVGGLPESVIDGCTGYLVPPRDEVALADAILKLLNDPSQRHTMGKNGRNRLDAESSPEVVAAQTLNVYGRILALPTVAQITQQMTNSTPHQMN